MNNYHNCNLFYFNFIKATMIKCAGITHNRQCCVKPPIDEDTQYCSSHLYFEKYSEEVLNGIKNNSNDYISCSRCSKWHLSIYCENGNKIMLKTCEDCREYSATHDTLKYLSHVTTLLQTLQSILSNNEKIQKYKNVYDFSILIKKICGNDMLDWFNENFIHDYIGSKNITENTLLSDELKPEFIEELNSTIVYKLKLINTLHPDDFQNLIQNRV